ncbi:hypothetical protein FFWV33_02375 [Flavobacterium faecale]|uniref:Uncharacterized protein n=1 Tax=Flavobacterium faecale TaxID=1355330 RepID=A0A2S1L9R0_9FLAO|nr:hypothetical protein [Flavobacterium faecale]AWG20454.1 hypothetical protein FFWV33_02375 [Flavobacterium faecale]
MIKKVIHSILPIVLLLAFVYVAAKINTSQAVSQLVTAQKSFIAGRPITLTFTTNSKTANASLFIIHTYGKTVVTATNSDGKLNFKIPTVYFIKTGIVSWYLIQDDTQTANGSFTITPNNTTPTLLENYLGPPSLLTGTDHFTMMVAIPTDSYDNPKENGTAVLIKDQFLDNVTVTEKKTKSFIAWKDIYSRTKSGKMLVSTECNSTDSKEFETEIKPSPSEDFTIDYARNHQFADGNQITTVKTSVIKDRFDNLVGDGTVVMFQVITNANILLKSYAATINGVAIGQILHPDHEDTYKIKAYVTGIAQSKPISVSYKPLIKTFKYTFSEQNRKITVGPVRSFMKQLVPDGVKVELKIFHKKELLETKIVETNKGLATFILLAPFYPKKEYQFTIKTLGITQQTEIKKYETN